MKQIDLPKTRLSTQSLNQLAYQKHFESKGLDKDSTGRNFRTVRHEGKRKVPRDLDHYKLDLIISLGLICLKLYKRQVISRLTVRI